MKTLLFGQFVSVELMRTGTWDASTGRVKIDVGLLEDIVKNYASLRGLIDIPMKLGHAASGNLLPKGMPAAGWVSNLKLSDRGGGNVVLLADIETTSETITELIRNGAYKNLSVEIHGAFEDGDGNKYTNVLTGLALLGAELPAVKGLKDIGDSYLDKKVAATDGAGDDVTLYTDELEAGPVKLNALTLLALCLTAAATDEEITTAIKPLGLKLGATDEDIVKAIGAKAAAVKASGETKEERLAREAKEAEEKAAAEKAAAEKAAAEGEGESADLAAANAQIAELTARADARDKADRTKAVEACVDEAVGKVLMPASRKEFVALGEKAGIKVLKAALDKLPELKEFTVSGGKGGKAKTGDENDGTVPEDEIAMAAAMGISVEDMEHGAKLLAANN